jgi:hypothetical protein
LEPFLFLLMQLFIVIFVSYLLFMVLCVFVFDNENLEQNWVLSSPFFAQFLTSPVQNLDCVFPADILCVISLCKSIKASLQPF